MKKNVTIKYFLVLIVFLLLMTISNTSNAATEYSKINNRWFYIKNEFTGHYLDVDNGIAQGGTNVQQCQYNGSYAQKWYIMHRGNGEYMICSDVGSTTDGNTTYVNYALDVDNGTNANGTQIHIWDAVMDGTTQTFSFEKTSNSTYIIKTKCSNYTKAVSLSDNLCDDGINVHQWEYSNHSHDRWILEPVDLYPTMGVDYAKAIYDKKLDAYPNLVGYASPSTNFVSQCLLAGGKHQNDRWYMKRRNTNYSSVLSLEQLHLSWNSDPSWLYDWDFYYAYKGNNTHIFSAANITNNPGIPPSYGYEKGDVMQVVSMNNGIMDGCVFNSYITSEGKTVGSDGVTIYDALYTTYPGHKNWSIADLAKTYSNFSFIFYDFTR